jgi:hypothetical protein
MKILILVLVAFIFQPPAQQQGICGKILWVEGNRMPGPSKRPAPKGIVREIYVYEITTPKQALQHNLFFSNVSTKLVAKDISETDGSYKINLPPGRYSVFVKEKNGLFANIFDQNGAINPVTVESVKWHH